MPLQQTQVWYPASLRGDTQLRVHQFASGQQDPLNTIEPHMITTKEEIENCQVLKRAFLVPSKPLDDIYALRKVSIASQRHSAILTIPTKDHVASLILSIPRTEAVAKGDRYNLPVIFKSDFLSS